MIKPNTQTDVDRIKTGVRNLDAILGGGFPSGSLVVFAGDPGSGKTILSQQIGFHNASVDFKVIFFQTLSEPMVKTLSHTKRFSYFDQSKVGKSVYFVDLGDLSQLVGLEKANALIKESIKKIKPALVVIDSFKAFEDLSSSPEELRCFSYKAAINMTTWECTCFLIGEYEPRNTKGNPVFSIIDGIVTLSQDVESGEEQRFIQISKMRSTNHSRDRHSLAISSDGIEVYAPKVTIRRDPKADQDQEFSKRCKTGVSVLDDLVEGGIPRGSAILVSGAAGTGKTLLGLEFIYKGVKVANEKGILFTFEETEERIRVAATSMGWDLTAEINRGMIEIVTISQPDILVDKHVLMMHERIARLSATRVVIDSTSVLLYKVTSPQILRERIYQLATIIQSAHAVGLFISDIPYGKKEISRFGVEETIVDGIVLLTAPEEEGSIRERYLEVYKLRNSIHKIGKHRVQIAPGGMVIQPTDSKSHLKIQKSG
ncbi:unnamed protein product [Sphagnum tenellum]